MAHADNAASLMLLLLLLCQMLLLHVLLRLWLTPRMRLLLLLHVLHVLLWLLLLHMLHVLLRRLLHGYNLLRLLLHVLLLNWLLVLHRLHRLYGLLHVDRLAVGLRRCRGVRNLLVLHLTMARNNNSSGARVKFQIPSQAARFLCQSDINMLVPPPPPNTHARARNEQLKKADGRAWRDITQKPGEGVECGWGGHEVCEARRTCCGGWEP